MFKNLLCFLDLYLMIFVCSCFCYFYPGHGACSILSKSKNLKDLFQIQRCLDQNCLRQTWRKILKPFMFYRIFLNPLQTEISRLLWSLYLQVAVHNRCCPVLPHLSLTDGLTEPDYR